ncbi:hypothetical protein CH358_19315 [Leptospira meyeri]|nr:hypothetical protein CH358_19315 [Leptospira meyeri]
MPPQASFQSLTSLPGTQGRGTSLSLVRYTTFFNHKYKDKHETFNNNAGKYSRNLTEINFSNVFNSGTFSLRIYHLQFLL